jgi:2-keto-3-deoxy-L-arabinonate dehydratase
LYQSVSGYHGVYPMIYCYFDKYGEIFEEPIRASVKSMVKHNIQGIAVLGLASEVNKLSHKNKIKLLECVCDTNQKRLPISVTISENSVPGQIEFVKIAKGCGADWFVLQPPPVPDASEGQLIDFFSAVIEKVDGPVGIQNAPQYLGFGLSTSGIKTLLQRHENFKLIKTEFGSCDVKRLFDETAGKIDIFNGVGGCELPDVIRAGAAGVIPGSESFDVLLKIYNSMRTNNEQEAENLYREILPLLLFLEDSIDHLVNYGKIALSRRLQTLEGSSALPSAICTDFGLQVIQRYVDALPKL